MARPLRIEFPGAVWHVTSRGNERRPIFKDDDDRERYLATIGKIVEFFRWHLHGYVLMNNHYHLLIETPNANLSLGMRQLNGLYVQGFNRRHGRVGHLFQGRFKGILIEKESHLLELCRYVVLNPVRAGAAGSAREYRWSNYRATGGLGGRPKWLETEWTLSHFGQGRGDAHKRYRQFVSEGMLQRSSPWEDVASQLFLGSERFRDKLRQLARQGPCSRDIVRSQRDFWRPNIETIVATVAEDFETSPQAIRNGRGGWARMLVALVGRMDGGLRLGPIAEALRLDVGTVSHLARDGGALTQSDKRFRSHVKRVRDAIHLKVRE